MLTENINAHFVETRPCGTANRPGSYHVMLIGLKKPLTAGERFPITLTFERAGNISVTVPAEAMGATQDKGGMATMGGMQDGKSGGGMGNMEMK